MGPELGRHWAYPIPLTFFFNNFIYLFIFGCAGSSLPCKLFSRCGERGATLCCSAPACLVAEHRL